MGAKKPYLHEVGEVVNETLRIVEQIRVPNGKKYTQKGYVVQSLVYLTTKPYKMTEYSLKNGQGCSYVSGQKICPENSLWSKKKLNLILLI